MSWSARSYLTFEGERTRPVRDLLAAVPGDDARSAVDIGCGPGNSTEVLVRRFPVAAVSAFDSSPDMIEAARKRLPGVAFETLDVATWAAPGPFDIILANAVFQWLPDHAVLLPALTAKLAHGGSLAVQIPDNLDEPSHVLMRHIAAEQPWAHKLSAAAAARTKVAGADWYYGILRRSCARVDVWRTTYHHPLAGGAAAIADWFKSSALLPFLGPLDDDARAQFVHRYTSALANAYPATVDGTILLPFPRLFIVATR